MQRIEYVDATPSVALRATRRCASTHAQRIVFWNVPCNLQDIESDAQLATARQRSAAVLVHRANPRRAQVVLKTLVLFHRLMHETFPACTRFTQK
jgi:hypothetical protein